MIVHTPYSDRQKRISIVPCRVRLCTADGARIVATPKGVCCLKCGGTEFDEVWEHMAADYRLRKTIARALDTAAEYPSELLAPRRADFLCKIEEKQP